jgi:HEAT repeat protein
MRDFEPEYAFEPGRQASASAGEPEYAFEPGYRDPAELLAEAAGYAEPRDPRRLELIGKLQRRTDAAAFAAAAEAARSAELALRVTAMEVLGQLGYPADRPYREQTLPILLAEIDQAVEPRLLQVAITATAHLGDGRALTSVLRHTEHRDALVRRAVAFTLPTLGGDPAAPPPAVLEALIELSRDTDAQVRDWAVFGLGELLELDTPALRAALGARLADLPAIAARARDGLDRRG